MKVSFILTGMLDFGNEGRVTKAKRDALMILEDLVSYAQIEDASIEVKVIEDEEGEQS